MADNDIKSNIGNVLRNNQSLIEVLREDRAATDEQVLGLKLANKNANKNMDALNAQIKELEESQATQAKRLEEYSESVETLRSRLEGVQWYLGKVSNQEITPGFLREVHEMYLAELDERKALANKRSVEAAHANLEKENEQKAKDENDVRNRVAHKQKELRETYGESTDTPSTPLVDVETPSHFASVEVVPPEEPAPEPEHTSRREPSARLKKKKSK